MFHFRHLRPYLSPRLAAVVLTFWAPFSAHATIVPALSFHELVSKSSQIVTGRVVGSSVSWGSEHKFIWTRYEISVDRVLKGPHQKTLIVSEPGGTLDGVTMRIAGAVSYTSGERVALFLEHYPSGDKRTVGWSQGKIPIDSQNTADSIRARVVHEMTKQASR